MLFIKNDQIVFIINYKCLFSTFNKLVDNKNILKKKNIKSIQILSKKQFYIIVKNPIKKFLLGPISYASHDELLMTLT